VFGMLTTHERMVLGILVQRRTLDAGTAAATTAIKPDEAQAALDGLVAHGLAHAGSYRLASATTKPANCLSAEETRLERGPVAAFLIVAAEPRPTPPPSSP